MRKKRTPVTDETREKLRQASLRNGNRPPSMKGKKMSQEQKAKIRESNLGKERSLETRKKMSISMIGARRRLGTKTSDKARKRMSEAQRAISQRKGSYIVKQCAECMAQMEGKKSVINKKKFCGVGCRNSARTGERSWAWKGGITPLTKQIRHCFKSRQWRSDIFARDDFTCVLCGERGGEINADHYPVLFSEIFQNNKITSLEEALICEEFWNINNGRTLCVPCHKAETAF
jgi:hypothetical protein